MLSPIMPETLTELTELPEERDVSDAALKDCDMTHMTISHVPMKGIDVRTCAVLGWQITPESLQGMRVTSEQAAELSRLLGLVID